MPDENPELEEPVVDTTEPPVDEEFPFDDTDGPMPPEEEEPVAPEDDVTEFTVSDNIMSAEEARALTEENTKLNKYLRNIHLTIQDMAEHGKKSIAMELVLTRDERVNIFNVLVAKGYEVKLIHIRESIYKLYLEW